MATPPPPMLLVSLHYSYPTLVFLYFLVSSAVATCSFQKSNLRRPHTRRLLIFSLLLAIAISYGAQIVLTLAHWEALRQDAIVSLLACTMVFALEAVILHDDVKPPWPSYVGSLIISLIMDPTIAALSIHFRVCTKPVVINILGIVLLATRWACVLLALITYFAWRNNDEDEVGKDSERQSLLRKSDTAQSEVTLVSDYGSTDTTSEESGKANGSTKNNAESEWERSERLAREKRDKRLQESGNWVTYAKGFKLFLPYIWPVNDRRLQCHAVLVGFCLLVKNALNVLIPNQLGIVTKSLTETSLSEPSASPWNPWIQVLIFAGLKLSASEAGISLLRQRLWLPVEQYSERAILEAAHSHILNLDAHFHDTKSLSDMLMAIQNGESISRILETICFQALPNLIDLGIAFIYLTAKFGPWEGLITVSTTTVFIYLSTAAITRSRAIRQQYTSAWYEEWYVMNSGISGWTTVASFNQVDYENRRYSAAVQDRIQKSKAYTLNHLSAQAVQYLVLLTGLLAGLFLAVWKVTREHSIDSSDFVVLLTYWSQLVSPLDFFASLGKSVSRNLIDAERLLEIMETESKVVSKPDAPCFQFKAGKVDFRDVRFSYEKKKEILKNVSFTVTPGQTIAFVGQTGAGKSTILKLLDRFYDVTEGSIRIDGQDIRDVDLYSLRAHIGVVPQNPVLFNDSVIDNVRYARLDATDEEVYDACKAASIHDQILTFSDGYKTRVGERGMKLSGGELQRVAIARAILKQPKIVLLDEATSAVDTETESKIQSALRRLCKNRTTFIVAHRLSTIVNADRIMVVNNGEIIEQGTHDDLIAADGKYAELWSKQIFVKPRAEDSSDEEDSTDVKKSSQDSTVIELLQTEDATNDTVVNDTEQSAEVKTPSGHRREGSRLNPGAPEFTPRSRAAIAAAATASPIGNLENVSHDPFSQTLTPVQLHQPRVIRPVISLPRPVIAHSVQPSSKGSSENSERGSTAMAAETHAIGEADQGTKKRKISYKIPRYTRRNQSRSEPSDNSHAMG